MTSKYKVKINVTELDLWKQPFQKTFSNTRID